MIRKVLVRIEYHGQVWFEVMDYDQWKIQESFPRGNQGNPRLFRGKTFSNRNLEENRNVHTSSLQGNI